MVLAYFSLAAREEGRDGKIGTNVSTKYKSRHLLLQLQMNKVLLLNNVDIPSVTTELFLFL